MDNNKKRIKMLNELKKIRKENDKLIELINILLRLHP